MTVLDEASEPPVSDNESSEAEDEADESDRDPVETLVAGRERRQKAANRYGQLLALAQEEEAQDDDELALLFHEEDEDIEFEDPDAVEPISEAEADSSTDEEDNGPTAGDDDFEGERQLEKEERAKRRADKRKADKAFTQPPAMRKKVKIDESTPTAAARLAEKQRKKSERVSWIPSDADGSIRKSSRTLSVQNKERTLASMRESEGKRARQVAVMEAAQKRKQVEKAKPMTQAERMAEAAKTERLNSKSLNKWEETEKDRMEKQKARLEALQNRKLEGPVIRWYSGSAVWVDDTLIRVGKRTKIEEVNNTALHNGKNDSIEPKSTDAVSGKVSMNHIRPIADEASPSAMSPAEGSTKKESASISMDSLPGTIEAPDGHPSFLDGLEYYASLPESGPRAEPAPRSKTGLVLMEPVEDSTNDITIISEAGLKPDASSILSIPGAEPPQPETFGEVSPVQIRAEPASDLQASEPLEHPKLSLATAKPEIAARNLITLLNFDATAVRDKDIQRRILFSWPPPSATSNSSTTTTRKYTRAGGPAQSAYTPGKPIQPVCAITAQPAKYRDPLTGLPYAGMEAFKAIRRLVQRGAQGAVWSNLLGAWVGPRERDVDGQMIMRVARGVPEGFLAGGVGPSAAGKEVKAEGAL